MPEPNHTSPSDAMKRVQARQKEKQNRALASTTPHKAQEIAGGGAHAGTSTYRGGDASRKGTKLDPRKHPRVVAQPHDALPGTKAIMGNAEQGVNLLPTKTPIGGANPHQGIRYMRAPEVNVVAGSSPTKDNADYDPLKKRGRGRPSNADKAQGDEARDAKNWVKGKTDDGKKPLSVEGNTDPSALQNNPLARDSMLKNTLKKSTESQQEFDTSPLDDIARATRPHLAAISRLTSPHQGDKGDLSTDQRAALLEDARLQHHEGHQKWLAHIGPFLEKHRHLLSKDGN